MNRISSALVISLAFVLLVPVTAQATLSTAPAPLTWNIIGLDSNDPANGPNKFPVGTRVCSSVATTNVSVSFIWDTANPLINLRTGSLSTIILPSISAGGCADAYFEAEVTQVPAAFDTTRRYHITATDFSGTVSTPTPRELFVEHLISQSRNSISTVEYGPNLLGLTTVPAGGGMSLVVGNTYVVRLTGGTATQGYNQFEEFINFSNAIFQILGVTTSYSADNSPYVPNPNDKLYADACLWENDPNSPNYRSCVGGDFKAGGNTVVTTYTIKIIGGGGTSQTLSTLLYDFSGSSFHYNADYSTGARIGNIIDPTSANISKSFSPNPAPLNGVSALTITLTNPNGASLGGYNFVDNLPANLIVATPPAATTSGCGTPTLTAVAGSSTISFSNGTLAANSNCIIKVNVTPTATGLLTNTTNNLFVGTVDTGHSATAPLTVNNAPPPGTGICGLSLATWAFPTGFNVTTPAASTSTVGTSAAIGAGLSAQQTTESTITATAGSSSWGTNGGVATGAALTTTNNDYFQFGIDTTGQTSVSFSFQARRTNNGAQGLAVYVGTNSTPPETGTSVFNNSAALTAAGTAWTQFGPITVNSGLNPSGFTYFRIYGFNATNSNPGSDLSVDNIVFTGCAAGIKPTISKNFSPDPIAVNGVSTLTFTLTNPNAAALTGANFTDSLPTGVQVAATPAAATTCTGAPTWAPLAGATTLTFGSPTGGTIPASGSCTVSVNVTATTGGAHGNVSGFLSTTETGTSTGSVATDTLTAVLPPSIAKQFAPSPILPGGTSTLTFTITNPNQDNAISGVAFSDTFPVAPGAMTVASPANASTSGCGAPTFAPAPGAGSVSFTGGTIAGGGTCTVTVNVTAPAVGTYSNTSGNVSHIVNAQTVNGNTASDTLEVEPPTPSISLLKQIGLTPTGPWTSFKAVTTGPVYYRFTIENTGDVPLSPVTLTDNTVDVSACNAALVGVTLPVAVPANDNHIFQCVAGPFAITPGSHTNTAHATGTFAGIPHDSEDSSATYATAALTIDKSVVQPTYLNAGDVLNYNYLVTNSGFATLSAPVTVTDDKTTVTCPAVSTVGDLDNFFDPGESMTCTATYIITAGDVTNAFVTNTAFATVDGVTSPTDSATSVLATAADLSLDKSVNNPTPSFGQNIVFTVTVSNAGPATANGVVARDLLPAGLSYVSDNGGGSYVSGTGVWTVGSIVSGGSASLQITATVNATGTISNYAQITAAGQPDPDSTPNDNSINQDDDDTQDIIVPPAADLSLDKSVNNPAPAFGQNVTFTITVSNAGPDTATGVVVRDLLPAGLTYVSDNGGGAYVSGTGVWTIGSIVSGGSASLQITATVNATGTISNYAQVTASGVPDPDSTPNDNSINQDDDDTQDLTVPPTADLSLDKSVDDDTPAFGQNVVFTVTVSNAGPDTATGVMARDLLPAGLSYVSDNGGGAYVSGTGVWTIGSIANGASTSLQITATVNATGTISNYAQVTASGQADPDSTPNDNSINQDDDDTQDLTVPSTADLSLDKSVDDDTPAFGQNIVFTITVSNGGPDTATGVVVKDLLPAGLTYVSDNGGGAYVSGTGIWTIGSILNGASASLQITATVNATGSISNYAQVTASGSLDPDSTPNDDSINQDDDDSQGLTVPPTADLSLDKSVNNPTPAFGGTVVFTITVSNGGPDTATGVVVKDLLPAGLSYVSDNGGGAYVSGTGIWTIGSIANGASASLQITATVTATGSISNYAQITASGQTDPDSTPNDDSINQDDDDSQGLTVPPTADLSLDKSVNNPTPAFGGTVVFTVTVSNAGPDTATGVVARDLLPAGLTYVSDNGGGAYVSGTGVWTIGSIANGASASLQITATVATTGTISNYAQVTASGQTDPDSTPNDNSINQDDDDTQDLTVPSTADLSLDKSVNNPTPALGGTVVFTITVSNGGPDTATGVVVKDLLPAGLSYVSDNGGGAYVSGTGIWTIGSIVNGGSASLQITATVTATGSISNYAQITASGSTDPDSTPNDDSINQDDDDSQGLTVPPTADLSLDKSVNNPTPAFGGTVVFTITVSNAGPDTATGVVARDLLPAGLTYVSDNGGGAYVSGTGVWTIGSIANGASASLQITATVAATGTISNYAQVTASGQTDPDSTPNDNSINQDDDDSQDLIVPSTADLSLDKSVNNPTPALGGTVVFTITVSNAGPDTATGVVVKDLLPAGLSYVSDNGGGAYVSGTGVWAIGSIVNGGSASLQITATVTATGSISNYAQITASGSTDPDSTPNDDSINQDDDDSQGLTVPPAADLSLDKSVDDSTPALNQNIVFTITVSNAGPDTATGVVVSDLLPAGLSYVSDNGGGAYVSGTGIWTIGSIANGASASLQITAQVTTTSNITNTAQITASNQTDPDSTPNNNNASEDDQDSVLIGATAADLSLNKSVNNATPALNANVTFTITVTNGGPDTATGVVVEDLLPAGLTYVSDNGGGAYVSGTGLWTIGSILNGASASLQITAQVTATGTISNYAQVIASDQVDPDSTPNDDSITQDDDDIEAVSATAADLSLDKSVDDATPAFGQNVVFTITVSNAGPSTATGVAVRDLLPAGLTYVSDNGGGAYVSGTGIWTIGSIANGASASLQITATVAATGTITNSAQVSAANEVDPDSTPNDNSTTQDDDDTQALVVPATADLALDKSVDDPTPAFGQNIVFTITVNNAGPDTATGITVRDLLGAGLTYVSDNGGGSYVSGTGIWTVGTLVNGASASLQITATVTATGQLSNYAQIVTSSASDPDSDPNDDSVDEDDDDTVDLPVPPTADLSLVKIVDDITPSLGQNVVFTITVSNAGPDTATGVVVTDQLPAGVSYVSDNGGGAYVSGTGVWTVGSLANGASASLQITAQVTTTANVTNTAQITAANQFDPDSTPNNNAPAEDDQDSASIGATAADLSLTKSVNNPTPKLNGNVTFTITVTNGGPDTATSVVVRDQLPAGLTYVSDNGGGAYVSGTGLWTVGSLANGASASLQITATVTSVSSVTNVAQVESADQIDPDSTPGNSAPAEDDYDTAAVDATAADLSLVKTVDNTTPALNGNITYTLTLTNAGPDIATNVTVRDQLPAGLTFVSSNASTGSFNNGTHLWTIASLGIGQSATLQIVATVTSTNPIVNTAQVMASDQGDPDSVPANSNGSEDDQDDAPVVVAAAAGVAIPTASEYGLLLMALMLAVGGALVMKAR